MAPSPSHGSTLSFPAEVRDGYVHLNLPAHGQSAQALPQNWDATDFDVKVENVRGREKSSEFSLDVTGFEFHKSPSVVEDFGNEELIKSKYYDECIQNLKSITGASRVVIFDHSKCD